MFVWNPFSQKALAQLQGHTSSVTMVLANDANNQILSLDNNKTVKESSVGPERGVEQQR